MVTENYNIYKQRIQTKNKSLEHLQAQILMTEDEKKHLRYLCRSYVKHQINHL